MITKMRFPIRTILHVSACYYLEMTAACCAISSCHSHFVAMGFCRLELNFIEVLCLTLSMKLCPLT